MRSAWLPQDAARFFARVEAPWWVAAGWALDLAHGRAMREHHDLDLAILRRDQEVFRAALRGWDVHVGAGDDVLAGPWMGEAPPDKPALWCRERPEAPWAFELLLSEVERDEWVFRHDPAIRMPLARVGRRTPEGIPYLAPEVVLLHKARRLAERDAPDFERALVLLDRDARAWLRIAIARVDPTHAWLSKMKE